MLKIKIKALETTEKLYNIRLIKNFKKPFWPLTNIIKMLIYSQTRKLVMFLYPYARLYYVFIQITVLIYTM